jgi:prolipoprotein diacylglyceryltransferase
VNGEQVFRHPAQLYEACWYLMTFSFLMYLYWKTKASQRPGLMFGTFMIILWTVRFVVEFVKVEQTERDGFWMLNTGQLLSIPMIFVGVYFLFRALRQEPTKIG